MSETRQRYAAPFSSPPAPTHEGRNRSSRTPDAKVERAGREISSRRRRRGRGEGGGARGSRRALCLWLPTFELRLELVRSPELDSTSVALLSTEGGTRRTLRQVSERAHEAGVRPGQLVSQAVSLCPSLTLLEPDPAHYDAAHESMIETLTDLTPVVDPGGIGTSGADGLSGRGGSGSTAARGRGGTDGASSDGDRGRIFLGMDGLERLYGTPSAQIRRALRLLFRIFPPPLVAATRAGHAPGRFGAWVAATASAPGRPVVVPDERLSDFLARCPVSVLPVRDSMIQRLERLGVETLGELLRLPEPALVGQFGEEGRRARAWAAGKRVDPVRPLRRSRPIRVTLDFPAPVGRVETLHGAIDRLLERALARPARRGRSVLGLRLAARLEESGSWTVEHTLRRPTARKEDLAFALRSRMALSPPERAVEALALELVRFGAAARQSDLFDRSDASGREASGSGLTQGDVPPSLREAVKELKLRLGHSPLYRVVEMDPWSRIPERRHALLSFDP